eukprot:SAG11_NODE_872_length_6802_cov_8.951514_10_plen_127_part_00
MQRRPWPLVQRCEARMRWQRTVVITKNMSQNSIERTALLGVCCTGFIVTTPPPPPSPSGSSSPASRAASACATWRSGDRRVVGSASSTAEGRISATVMTTAARSASPTTGYVPTRRRKSPISPWCS